LPVDDEPLRARELREVPRELRARHRELGAQVDERHALAGPRRVAREHPRVRRREPRQQLVGRLRARLEPRAGAPGRVDDIGRLGLRAAHALARVAQLGAARSDDDGQSTEPPLRPRVIRDQPRDDVTPGQ